MTFQGSRVLRPLPVPGDASPDSPTPVSEWTVPVVTSSSTEGVSTDVVTVNGRCRSCSSVMTVRVDSEVQVSFGYKESVQRKPGPT